VSLTKGDHVDVAEFEACWHEHIRRVTAYAERHVGRDASYDIAASTFLTSQRPRGRHRWIAAIGLCGAVAIGGGAYAGGLVPTIVSERFQQMHDGDDGWPHPIVNERQIADVVLSNGRHARVWLADTTDGQCVIRDMRGEVSRPEGFGVGCALWGGGNKTQDAAPHWQTSPDGPAVVYGEFTRVDTTITSVQVSGPGWTRTFQVEEKAFAGEVPVGADGDLLHFAYLDARGFEIAHRSDTVMIESE
jgi:hypothetical protein